MTDNNHIHTKKLKTERLLRWPSVSQRVGICRSHAESLVREGKFPRPIKLSERVSAWVESDISDWIDERISQNKPNKT